MWGESIPATIHLHLKEAKLFFDLPEDVATNSQIMTFCKRQMLPWDYSVLFGIDIFYKNLDVNHQQCIRCVCLELGSINDGRSFELPLFYVRNKKLYGLNCDKGPFEEWAISLTLFCTAFFKIILNEIYYKTSVKLRLRGIVCMFVAPMLGLMGVLMPFAAYYFNRIVGDLDCWMNGFDNKDISKLSLLERRQKSKRCFAPVLQPYGFIGENPDAFGNIHIDSLKKVDPQFCVPRLVQELVLYVRRGNFIKNVVSCPQ